MPATEATPETILIPIRYGSVCSGIESASAAWKHLGWEAAWFAEIAPEPSAVLEYRYPGVTNLGDFTTIGPEYGPVDVLVGGTPCQSFSLAGLRGGIGDSRGNLALEFIRLVGRINPRWVVWENVPGVLSSGGGRDFGSLLGGLAKLGYSVSYRVLDAVNFGCACTRRRVFVVGYLGDWRNPASVLFEPGCISRDCERVAAESEAAPVGVEGSGRTRRAIAVTDRKRSGGRMAEWRINLAYSPIVRRGGGNKTARQIVDLDGRLRCLTPRETERLLGFPDDYTLVPYRGKTLADTHRNAAIGNSMAVPVMRWLGERIQKVDSMLTARRGAHAA